MRLVTGLLALTLTGSLAYADEANTPEPQPTPVATARSKVSFRVVRVMPESHQALLFDKNRGTHVLADVGSVIGTYTVMEITEDEVTLSSAGRELVLSAPEPAMPAKKEPVADTKPAAAATPVAPDDPYADADPVPGGPDDPYAPDDEEVRTVAAPKSRPAAPSSVPMTNPYDEAALEAALTAGAGSVRVAGAPDPITITEMEHDPYAEPAQADETTTMDSDAAKPAAKPAKDDGVKAFVEAMNGHVIVKTPDEPTKAAPAPAPAPVAEPSTMLSRKEVNSALSDFGVLTASVRGGFTPEGARLDAVAPGSVFAKAGLRAGDVITSVDGQPLTSIDHAADLYIRAGSARTANVQLVRAGKPMTLRLAIK